MRGMMRIVQSFSKKLSIADTAKVIQDKIMNISQVVPLSLPRTTLKSSELSLALETVSPELSDSTRSRLEKWWSSAQASEAWPSISKLIMSVSSSSETIGPSILTQINSRRRHCH